MKKIILISILLILIPFLTGLLGQGQVALGATLGKEVRRLSAGHLYTEDFDNLDSWNTDEIVSASIVSNQIEFAGDYTPQTIHMYLTAIASREDVFVECELKTSANTWANWGLWVRFALDTFPHAGICNWNRDNGYAEHFRER